MKKQHDTNTAFRHIPTEYDSSGLGRDDPVWPRYIAEATKWDAQLVEGWHKGMDVILLFAALFSAIVTAFLIESHKLLKFDNDEMIASGVPAMVELLQTIASGQSQSLVMNITNPSVDFKSTRTAVAINAAWFLSLTLSVSVALLAMLVKQWGEGYRHGHDLSPPCVQARVRQARYDKLKQWRTEDIALALPVLMHTALGLFLLGLVMFLHELNTTILALVLIVVVTTFVVYLGTTLMPLFIEFCPYDTPLSSRRFWALICAILYRVFDSDYGTGQSQAVPLLKCQQKEKDVSEKSRPDEYTVRALGWLIGHSGDGDTIDVAIRAVSNTLEAQLHEHLAQDPFIKLLAQKFTAIFNGALDEEIDDPGAVFMEDDQLEKAALYGRALTNITRHIQMQPISYRDVQGYTTGKNLDSAGTAITLMEDQVKAVERGLFLIASSKNSVIASSGATSLSAWYTTNRAAQSRDKWKTMLIRLIEILSNSNRRRRLYSESHIEAPATTTASHNLSPQEEPNQVTPGASVVTLESGMLDRIVNALLLELAHWRWDLSKQERQEILKPLINLFASPLLDGPSRPGMSATLAIFALLFHDHQEFSTDDNWVYVPEPGPEGDKLDIVQDFYEQIDPKPTQPWRSRHRSELARDTAQICQNEEEYMRKNTDALLFFGLAGLLDSVSVLGLVEMIPQVVEIVTAQLNAMPAIFHSGPVSLSRILPSTTDVRAFMADALARSLSPSPFKGQLHPFPDEEKASLLECLWDKNYLWSDFGNQFLLPIVQLLHLTQNERLKGQCLIAISEYCLTNSSPDQDSIAYNGPLPMDWKFFFSLDIPYRLAEIMRESEALQSKAAATFDSIMQMIPSTRTDDDESRLDFGSDVKNRISATLCQLAVGGLLNTFAAAVLCRPGHDHLHVWRSQLMDLPDWLDSAVDHGHDPGLVKAKLRQFCTENTKQPGHMKILTLGLGGKLDAIRTTP